MRSILSILRDHFRMDFQRFDIIHEIARIILYPGISSTCPNGNCCSRYYTQIASEINHPSGPSRSALALVHCGDIPQAALSEILLVGICRIRVSSRYMRHALLKGSRPAHSLTPRPFIPPFLSTFPPRLPLGSRFLSFSLLRARIIAK